MSYDSNFALVRVENPDMDYVEMYNDNELHGLLSSPEWRQPCINCEG